MNFFESIETDRSLSITDRLLKSHLEKTFRSPLKWPLCDEDPADWKRVQFKSDSGGMLTSLYAPSFGTSRGTIVCAHPLDNSAKCHFLQNGYSKYLRTNGYNVVLFDFNGFGESSSGNLNFSADVLAAGKTASVLFDSDQLGFWGIGFGASWGLSGLKHKHMFRVGIFESPFSNFRKYLKHHPELKLGTRLFSRVVSHKSTIVDFLHAKGIERLLFLFDEDNNSIQRDTRKHFVRACRSNWPTDSEQLPWLEWPSARYDFKPISKNNNNPGQVLDFLDQYFRRPDENPDRAVIPQLMMPSPGKDPGNTEGALNR